MEIPPIVTSAPERKDDPDEMGEAPVGSNARATGPEGVGCEVPKTRSRHGNGETLPAAQRWKRRLPRILRQAKSAS